MVLNRMINQWDWGGNLRWDLFYRLFLGLQWLDRCLLHRYLHGRQIQAFRYGVVVGSVGGEGSCQVYAKYLCFHMQDAAENVAIAHPL